LDKLEKVLVKYRSKKFLVVEPGGNNGDRLIYMGMEKKLKELGIEYTVLRYEESPSFSLLHILYFGPWKRILNIVNVLSKSNNSLETVISKIDKWVYERTLRTNIIQADPAYVILIHGGANINDLYGHGIRLLKSLVKHNPNSVVIVAPQTYWFRETSFPELFLNAGQEIHLFCREKYSYNLLKSMNLPENVHINLSHDTIFYLSEKDFHARNGAYDLICFRTDKESAIFRKTRDLIQLSEKAIIDLRQSKKRIVAGDISLLDDFRDFVNLIEGSRKVFTDRLHVAILATILGKDTILYPNSYYKNKGVYEYSLSKYSNLKFVENFKHFEIILKEAYSYIQNFGSPVNSKECVNLNG